MKRIGCGAAAAALMAAEDADVGYRWYEGRGHEPPFPFGHGLSYTRFACGDPVVTGGQAPSVGVEVANTGRTAGADVPQLYAALAGSGKPMRLAAFQRVQVRPGGDPPPALARRSRRPGDEALDRVPFCRLE